MKRNGVDLHFVSCCNRMAPSPHNCGTDDPSNTADIGNIYTRCYLTPEDRPFGHILQDNFPQLRFDSAGDYGLSFTKLTPDEIDLYLEELVKQAQLLREALWVKRSIA